MKKTFIILTSLIILTFASSCRKEIQESDADFIGYWSSSSKESYIEIYQDGTGNYSSNKGFIAKRYINGALVHINDNILRISVSLPPLSLVKYKRFKIDQRPTITNDSTYMILDGISFRKN